MIGTAVAALFASRLGFHTAGAPPVTDGARPIPEPAPRGWREARHWRKI